LLVFTRKRSRGSVSKRRLATFSEANGLGTHYFAQEQVRGRIVGIQIRRPTEALGTFVLDSLRVPGDA